MYKFSGAISIDIKAEPGIYTFSKQSGTGKTYLRNTLNQLRLAGEPVIGFNVADELDLNNFDSMVKSGEIYNNKVVMLDRYDLRAKELGCMYSEIINKLSDRCIVLIECKRSLYVTGLTKLVGGCSIEFDLHSFTIKAY